MKGHSIVTKALKKIKYYKNTYILEMFHNNL